MKIKNRSSVLFSKRDFWASAIPVIRQPFVLAMILSCLFYLFVVRHNAAVAFSSPLDPTIYKISVLLKISFLVVSTIVIHSIILFIRQVRTGSIFARQLLFYSSIYFALLAVVLLLIFPGHWVWDEFNILEVVRTYTPYAWQNYYTNIWYTYCLFVFPSAISIVVMQMIIIALVVGYVSTTIRLLTRKKYAPYILMAVFLLPPILINNLYPLRITLYSYVEILLVIYLFNSFIKTRLQLSPQQMIFVIFLIGLLSFWRSEGIYYLLLIPILLLYSGLINRKNWNDFQTYAVLSPSFVVLLVMGVVTYLSNDNRYAITTMINPLSIMIHEPLRGAQTADRLADMEKTLDMDILRQYPSYTEIPAYWNGVLRPNYADNLKSFRSDYLYIATHNPDYFLEARAKTFLATNGFTKEYPPVLPIGLLGRNAELTASEVAVAEKFESSNSLTTVLNPDLKQATTRTLLGINADDKLTFWGHLFWNLLIPIAMLVTVFIHAVIRRRFFWAIACTFILLRAPIIFITAPASYFMYYLPVYISGITLTIFYILMHSSTKRKRFRGVNS